MVREMHVYTLADLIHVMDEIGFGENWEIPLWYTTGGLVGDDLVIIDKPDVDSIHAPEKHASVDIKLLLRWALLYAREHIDEERTWERAVLEGMVSDDTDHRD